VVDMGGILPPLAFEEASVLSVSCLACDHCRVRLSSLVLSAVATGVGGIGYTLLEAHAFTLRRVVLPILPTNASPLTLLHISDLHLVPRQHHKVRWLRDLAAYSPDLVISTGDTLASADAVQAALEAHGDLLDLPGAFVLGSNDYFAPRPKNPARYLLPRGGRRRIIGERLPTGDLVAGFTDRGWVNLSNRRRILDIAGTRLELVGVDDPHLRLDRYQRIAGPTDPQAALTIGVAHAPYRRVLDAMAADGAGLLLCGHTHGGQLCVPWYGALVTNCDLGRKQVKGLSRWPTGESEAGGRPDDDKSAWLHVSAGMGTSPYTPVRFACRPEASLLTLVGRRTQGDPEPEIPVST
jgi:uncharacterized protein